MLDLDRLEIVRGAFRLTANWSAGPGVTGIVGPSGGGKSTLLAAIGGFVAPRSGHIRWQGAEITGTAPKDRPVATLFQDHNLFPHLTVAQNVGLGLRPDLRAAHDHADRIAEVLGRVGLAGMGNRRPGTLSGGQQGRVALARVLLMERPVVLLDEPFSALDPDLRRDMLDLVDEVLAGRTVLMVSHAPDDIERLAARVVEVRDGVARLPAPK